MTKEELQQIINAGEGHKTEFMAMPANLDRELIAFANASGGKILIGVDDSGNIAGSGVDDDLKAHILDMAKNCRPPIRVSFDEYEEILVVEVQEGWNKPHRFSSGFYLRNGPVSHKFERDELVKLMEKVGRVRFEEIFNTDFELKSHFDMDKYNNFVSLLGVEEAEDMESVLSYFGLAEKQDDQLLFTNLGALLFARDMAELFKHTGIRCARYDGTERLTIQHQQEYGEDLLSSLEGAIRFLGGNLPELKTGTIGPDDIHSLPYDAIEEAVINAVVHRDYFEEGNSIKIEVFDNRVVISNPGGLVSGITTDDFGQRSLLRNPYLADIFHKMGLLDRWGTGISEMQRLIEDARLRPIDFDFNGYFQVTFWRPKNVKPTPVKKKKRGVGGPVLASGRISKTIKPPSTEGIPEHVKENLGDRYNISGQQLDRLYDLLCDILNGKSLNYDKFHDRYDVSTKTVKRDIKKLKQWDFIEFQGAPKTGKYVMKKSGEKQLQKLAE